MNLVVLIRATGKPFGGDVTTLERGMLAEREMLQSSKVECWRNETCHNPRKRNLGGVGDIAILKSGMLAEWEMLQSSKEECWRSG